MRPASPSSAILASVVLTPAAIFRSVAAQDGRERKHLRRAADEELFVHQDLPNKKEEVVNGIPFTTDEDGSDALDGVFHFVGAKAKKNPTAACAKWKKFKSITKCAYLPAVNVGRFTIANDESHGNGAKKKDFVKSLLFDNSFSDYVESVGANSAVYSFGMVQENGALWNLDFMDGNDENSYNYIDEVDASKITIVIMDTGVDCSHQEFGHLLACDSSVTFISNDNTDGDGHGTHCAGTAIGKNVGVAKGLRDATLWSYKVLNDQGSGSSDGIIQALNKLVEECDKDTDRHFIASLSLGGSAYSPEDEAVNRLALRSNCHVVVAAGNSNADACKYTPARAAGAITVGSINNSSPPRRSSFSNYGRCVDTFAPGTSIESSWIDGDYRSLSGTSMSTPHVTGALAVLLATGKDVETELGRSPCGIADINTKKQIRRAGQTPDVCATTAASLVDIPSATAPPDTTAAGTSPPDTTAPVTTSPQGTRCSDYSNGGDCKNDSRCKWSGNPKRCSNK